MELSVISLNIRYQNPADGENQWAKRRQAVGQFLFERSPDWIALQEVLPSQRRDLDAMLPAYRSYGISRDGQGKDEQCCWYVRDPWWFELATTHWLSETPQEVSRGWDALLPRVASVVRLRSPQGSCWAANVHLDHAGGEARRRGLELVAKAAPVGPALIVGDFNQEDLWAQVESLRGWQDAQSWAGQSHLGTFHDFRGGSQGPRIDAILASPNLIPIGFEVVQDARLSDHYPLVARWAAKPGG